MNERADEGTPKARCKLRRLQDFLRCLGLCLLAAGPAAAWAVRTEQVTLSGTLDARSPISGMPSPATFPSLEAAAQHVTQVQIADSAGRTHPVKIYFFHMGANVWTAGGFVEGSELGGPAGVPSMLFSVTLAFAGTGDTSQASAAALVSPIPWLNGGAARPVQITFTSVFELDAPSIIFEVSPNRAACPALAACAHDVAQSSRLACQQSVGLCAQPVDGYLASATEIAEGAIAEANCPSVGAGPASLCRRCYARAIRLIPQSARVDRLSHGLLGRARSLVGSAKIAACGP